MVQGREYVNTVFSAADMLQLSFSGSLELSDQEKQACLDVLLHTAEKHLELLDTIHAEQKVLLQNGTPIRSDR